LFFGKRCTSRGEYQQAPSEDYSERVHIVAERIAYDSSLMLGFTTGRILLVSEGQLSGFGLSSDESILNRIFRGLGRLGK
jgi:hypothetical protein